jgi:hypothetical protein
MPPPDRRPLLDHVGLGAGRCAARGRGAVRARATRHQPATRRVPPGEAVTAMVRHGLGGGAPTTRAGRAVCPGPTDLATPGTRGARRHASHGGGARPGVRSARGGGRHRTRPAAGGHRGRAAGPGPARGTSRAYPRPCRGSRGPRPRRRRTGRAQPARRSAGAAARSHASPAGLDGRASRGESRAPEPTAPPSPCGARMRPARPGPQGPGAHHRWHPRAGG